MSRVLTKGPSGTPIEGLTVLTFAVAPLNYDADFRVIEEGVGKVIYTDVTSPQDQPSTLRIAQQGNANVYSRTSIDPSAYLPNRRGTDTIVEVREVWSETETTDSALLRLMPVRVAITLSLPTSPLITADAVEELVQRAVAALFTQGEATIAEGLTDLTHGVVKRT